MGSKGASKGGSKGAPKGGSKGGGRTVPAKTPLVLLTGLLCDGELWRHQLDTLSDVAEMSVPDLALDDRLGAMAQRALSQAPEMFALAGLSMGGYVAPSRSSRARSGDAAGPLGHLGQAG